MSKWWDLQNREPASKKELVAKIKYDRIVINSVKNFNEIVDNELKENVQYRFVTEMSFNALTVLSSILQKYEVENIYIAIYRMNQKSVNKLIELISENKIYCNIILSSFFRENKRYEKWANDLILFAQKSENAKVVFEWNHTKIFLAKTKCDKYIVFEGSGNLSDNARIEQYLLENNKQTFLFHQNWMEKILNKQE